ncbi:carbohydrate-binding module family 21 protein [Plicaturopsis crispa FD-325 SS-3]|nr:carbohydrate-binding module family 21 protein [Plicaturopsis crispa FD-325 SS-3]
MSLLFVKAFQPQISYPQMDHPFSRNSNAAGAPLPLIPRRLSATRPAYSQVAPQIVQSAASPERSPPASESSSSDEAGPTIAPRAQRIRGLRMSAVCPPEQSTPTPAVARARAAAESVSDTITPRPLPSQRQDRLRLNLDGRHTRHASDSHVMTLAQALSAPATSTSQVPPSVDSGLVRKKSGEPLKSSLKSMKRPPLGSITVVTGRKASKSEPNTPTSSKAVHFDAKLEHVKLFLAEQKPLAVSRDGSPTDDTSGTESDFPSFIFGSGSDEERAQKGLAIEVTNMPRKPDEEADIALKSLMLSQDRKSIHGRVRVRNIAFEKQIGVRFTFDWWQTTSEVAAQYAETQEGGKFDVFGFTINLNGMLPRIEEKTLFVALRYTVAGRDIWDNNGGQNYLAKFSRTKVQPKMQRQLSDDDGDDHSNLVNLKTKLEQVSQRRDSPDPFISSPRRASIPGPDDTRPSVQYTESPLSSRYDFAASLRSPWKGPGSPSSPKHQRMSTYPSSPNTIPWPQKPADLSKASHGQRWASPIGSPRDVSEIATSSSPTPPPQEERPLPVRRGSRNHQRGYFDLHLSESSAVKRTPPGTPTGATPSPRFHSFPPTHAAQTAHMEIAGPSSAWSEARHVPEDVSVLSTPSSASSSRETTPSPTTSLSTTVDPPSGPNSEKQYSAFLDRFCFYTGSDSLLDVPVDTIPRSHSASSVEEFLSIQTTPSALQQPEYAFFPPTRSSSFDDMSFRSGTSTPTGHGSFGSSHSSTPTIVSG